MHSASTQLTSQSFCSIVGPPTVPLNTCFGKKGTFAVMMTSKLSPSCDHTSASAQLLRTLRPHCTCVMVCLSFNALEALRMM